MVFSSVPLYLDPPNWQQYPNEQVLLSGNNNNNQGNHEQNLHLLPPHQQPHQLGGMGGGPGAQQIRPNSMAERARLAKIPPPEAPLKCPRCESTNTKFCYFNNYSLTQPRHFCKTCRRYWTRGGALRNVPVGGGCRRNKRASSKSSSGGVTTTGPSPTKSSISSTIMGCELPRHGGFLDHFMSSSLSGLPSSVGNNMSFMASLQNLAQLGGMSSNMGGLAFPSGSHLHNNSNNSLGGEFPQVNINGGAVGGGGGGGGVQFPNFLGGFEILGSSSGGGGGGSGLYSSSFQSDNNNNQGGIGGGGDGSGGGEEHEQVNNISKSLTTMMTPVKMEENGQQGLNLAKQLMGISATSHNVNTNNLSNNRSNQFWDGGAMANASGGGGASMWTDLSGLNSSSTSQQLL